MLQNQSQTVTVEDNDLYQIIFSVDTFPPETEFIPDTIPDYDPLRRNYRKIDGLLQCKDQAPLLQGKDFGCLEVEFCIAGAGGSCGLRGTGSTNVRFNISNDGAFDVLYRSVDKGGNVEAVNRLSFILDTNVPGI